jgi:hypothetical protein
MLRDMQTMLRDMQTMLRDIQESWRPACALRPVMAQRH